MATLLNIALINAFTVLPLAVLAIGVSRFARRPALTHALWVLVLLKFVTPPLFHLPVTIDMPAADVGHVSNVPVLLPDSEPNDLACGAALAPRLSREVLTVPHDRVLTPNATRFVSGTALAAGNSPEIVDPESPVASAMPLLASTLKTCSTFWARRPDLRSTLLTGWLGGSALWMSWQLVRAVRFRRRVLRGAVTSNELQDQADQLAAELGLRRSPRVLIVDAAVSPMLWGCGSRAQLLFPADLAERLDDTARATLVTHELAHFARGDHWVRLLELIATGLFWWHPVVWWAKQQIEASEEECCDSWVVSQFPSTPKLYAEALLDTIDYLCERRQALPPVACGLGQAHFLRHRLTKIMRGASPKAMTQRVRVALALTAALLLPLQPFVFGSASITSLNSVSIDEPMIHEASSPETTDEPIDPTGNLPFASSPAADAASTPVLPASVPSSRSRSARGERIWSTAASQDGRYVVRATTARRIVLTDLSTNAETDLSDQRISAVSFAPDGEWFAAAGQDGRITIWDSARGELLRTVLTHADVLRSVAVSPRGQAIAAGSRDGSVLIVDLATDELLDNLPSYPSAVNCVRFSSDGRQLAVAVGDWMSNARGEVALLDATNGRTVTTLTCATSPGALTFASNDELIVGLWDGRTQLWNLVSRQVAGSAMADKNVVSAAAFSPDNPALREAIFVAEEPNNAEDNSPFAVLRNLFTVPVR
ncbi:MAG: M56 family metallopeptidase [Planctomycetaceae bacterium]